MGLLSFLFGSGKSRDDRDLLEDLAKLGLEQVDVRLDESRRGAADIADRFPQARCGLLRNGRIGSAAAGAWAPG